MIVKKRVSHGSYVGDSCVELSGDKRQRGAIARAFL